MAGRQAARPSPRVSQGTRSRQARPEEAHEPSSALPREEGGGFTLATPPHAAEVECESAAESTGVIGRPHRGGEPELDAVGHGDGLCLVGEGLYGNHRTKDLGAACHGAACHGRANIMGVSMSMYLCEGVYYHYYSTEKVCANVMVLLI